MVKKYCLSYIMQFGCAGTQKGIIQMRSKAKFHLKRLERIELLLTNGNFEDSRGAKMQIT